MRSMLFPRLEQRTHCGERNKLQRGRVLEDAIKEAIFKLEQTKKSFKSKRVKEVREKLMTVINTK